MSNNKLSFSFGENWQSYVNQIQLQDLDKAQTAIEEWIEKKQIIGKNIIDIGCGSGIHSYAFYKIGASKIISFDYDPKSVEATKILWEKAGKPKNWHIFQGSILDSQFIEGLKKENPYFDIVYSWGVLHHTGEMWNALANTISLIKPSDGLLLIALYKKTFSYPDELKLKQKYNKAPQWLKYIMEKKCILKIILNRFKSGKNPFKWNESRERGMNVYHDLIDWLGGLPYEVATTGEVVLFCQKCGLKLLKVEDFYQANNTYLFKSN